MSSCYNFSIVTPNLNQGCFLQQNIDSVYHQNQSVQHIIFDALSSDNSSFILKKNTERLAFWSSESDSGQSSAINKGLCLASGSYVTWLNADDYYLPNALDHVASVFDSDESIDIVYGSSVLVDSINTNRVT